MPMENRRVVFTHEELRDALKNFPGMRENALPEGEITAIQPQRKNNDYFIEFSVLDFSTSKNMVGCNVSTLSTPSFDRDRTYARRHSKSLLGTCITKCLGSRSIRWLLDSLKCWQCHLGV